MHIHSVLRKSTACITIAHRVGLFVSALVPTPSILRGRSSFAHALIGTVCWYDTSSRINDDDEGDESRWRFPIAMLQETYHPKHGHLQWTVCSNCQGEGRRRKRLSKKAKFKRSQAEATIAAPTELCNDCQGSGLRSVDEQSASSTLPIDSPLHVAIVGGGLGGLALAAASQHRGIQVTVYERDASFHQRHQGYGLTMQQAAPQLRALGITKLDAGITSTKHIVHKADGRVVGEWGMRKWLGDQAIVALNDKNAKRQKRQNIHIARQELRYQLLLATTRTTKEASTPIIRWNHQFLSFQEMDDHVLITLRVHSDEDGTSHVVQKRADILVGADGIRSQVRQQLLGDAYPLRYLGCIVILGICPLGKIGLLRNPSFAHLLDGETVFQTADGTTRIYLMPYSKNEYMWQLSFPLSEIESKILSAKGQAALQQEAIRRCGMWHSPVGEILSATPVDLVSGYPVYDRDILKETDLNQAQNICRRVTLVGDAAHPMSPFKGQGANQALLDALLLARVLYKAKVRSLITGQNGNAHHPFDISEALLQYESQMLERSAAKVKASADAANFLHTDVAIQHGNVTRGAAAAAISCNHRGDEGGHTC